MDELTAQEKAKRIAELSLTKKAQDVTLIGLGKVSDVADYFVVCHGDSEVQVKAIADTVLDGMRSSGVRVWHKEGYQYLRWILLDYVDVVVHIFLKDLREFYGLERLWGDAVITTLKDEDEAAVNERS